VPAVTTAPPGVLFGAYSAPARGQDSEQAIGQLETRLGRRLDVARVFRTWSDPIPDLVVNRHIAAGRIPVVSWRPGINSGVKLPWRDIAAGRHDQRIRQTADWLRCQPGRVIVCLHHEPDLAQGYGDPPDYLGAWQRWVDMFRSRAADNVEHAWIVSTGAWKHVDGKLRADSLWPGADWVDWVGVDAYNWAGCHPGQAARWEPLADVVTNLRWWLAARGITLPVLLAEFGSVEDPADPARKAGWLAEVLAWLRSWPQVAAVSYQDAPSSLAGCDWSVDTSPAAWVAFRAFAADPYANTRPTGATA
jgi:hypothetical protein